MKNDWYCDQQFVTFKVVATVEEGGETWNSRLQGFLLSPLLASLQVFPSSLLSRLGGVFGSNSFQESETPPKPNNSDDKKTVTVKNELALGTEYIDDIYNFYKLTEVWNGRINDYMGSQPYINVKMRSILVDWLVEVHREFEFKPETLYLTINIVDRFLSTKVVRDTKELELVGISSMFIASKYQEAFAPEVHEFAWISDNNVYGIEQVLDMEKTILKNLKWNLTVPTPYVFLVRYMKASSNDDSSNNKEMKNMVFFLVELGFVHYPIVTLHCPSVIAASAVYAARCTLEIRPFWTETLKHYTGYSEEQLMECAKLMVNLHATASENKLRAVYKKFCSWDHCAVALHVPAKNLSATPCRKYSLAS